jgi:hypothetical protein
MNMPRIACSLLLLAAFAGILSLPQAVGAAGKTSSDGISHAKGYGTHFQTSDRCFPCHNGLVTPSGEDISIGLSWRSSVMGNSGRDPYWMASVRREVTDHPAAQSNIEDECTICHMPMMRYEAKLAGGKGTVFNHLPSDPDKLSDRLAEDGVSCTVCHQITGENLGTPESFVGGFKIDETTPWGKRHIFGPYDIDAGRRTIMRSSSSFEPAENEEVIRSAQMCATCHTLFTKALDSQGKQIGELPEQVPYQEWLHSRYKDAQTCQSCHMPVVQHEVNIASVFGEPQAGVSRHVFVGGNFLLQQMLNRYRSELQVTALPNELGAAADNTIRNLQSNSATISIDSMQQTAGHLEAEVSVRNLTGHKLPTAYPSRRAWLHFVVRDRNQHVIFESGALRPDGHIEGNDNDVDAARFEPHYTQITRPDQVEIYEGILAGPGSKVTTGLLTALRYIKDNRLLPEGFDKTTASEQIAVQGAAAQDPDFTGGGDRIRYSVSLGNGEGPFQINAELWYQPVGYRWASNLRPYNAEEPRRFVRYYDSMASTSAVVLAHVEMQSSAEGPKNALARSPKP